MRRFQFIRMTFVGAMTLGLATLGGCQDKRATPEAASSKATPVVSAPMAPRVEPPPVATPPKVATRDLPDGGSPGDGGDVVEAVAVADPGPDTGADELLGKARESLSGGDFDRALRLARRAVDKSPGRSAAHNTLGRALLQTGKKDEAIAAFEKAVELNPSSSWAHNNLGLALVYAGRYEDAIDALEEATEMEHVEPYMWNNLGMAYEHLDRLEEARDAYRKAAELKNDRATKNLARLEGVKSVLRTAKVERPKSLGEPVEPPTSVEPEGL